MPRKQGDEIERLFKTLEECMDRQLKVITDGHQMLSEKIDWMASELRSEMRAQAELLQAEIWAGVTATREAMRADRAGLRGDAGTLRSEAEEEPPSCRR